VPLTLAGARTKMTTPAAADVIAHWKFEELSGTSCVDAAASSNLTSTSSGNIVAGAFLGMANNRGRTWTTGPSTASGASTAGQRTALMSTTTVLHTCTLTSVAAAATMAAHGASGETEANNLLLSLEHDAGGQLLLRWERSAGTDVLASSGLTIPTGEQVLLGARRRPSATAAKLAVDFFIISSAGIQISTVDTLDPPTGGGSGAWIVGAQPGGGAAMTGTSWDLLVAGVALSDEYIRDAYAKAVRDWDLARLLASGEYQVHTRARIRNTSGAWVDLTDLYDVDFLGGWEDSDAVDDDGASARVTLQRRQDWLAVTPGVATSRPNVADPAGQLIDVARRIKLEEAWLPAGALRAQAGEVHWDLCFDGYIRAVNVAGEQVTLDLIDRIRALQAAWVQPNRSVSPAIDVAYAATPTAIETVLGYMLTDWKPAEGYAGGLDEVTLYTPTSPAFTLDGQFTVPATSSVAQAITDLVDRTIAWLLRFVWDQTRKEFRLTLADPGRSRTWSGATDRTIAAPEILAWRRIEVSDEDIRNDVEVEYGDVADGDNLTVNKRKSVRVTDSTSINRWWRRYCRVGLSTASELGTSGQATTLANAILSDLSSPLADVEIDILPTRVHVLGDLLKVTADGDHYSADQVFAVVGIRHSRSPDDRRTTLVLRGAKPVGRRRRWADLIDQVGVIPGDGLTPLPTPSAPTLTGIANGMVIDWTMPVNAGKRRYRETEVHVSTSSGFTPSSSTLVEVVRGKSAATLRNLLGNVTQYVKLVHRDDMGLTTTASAQASTVPRWLPKTEHVYAYRNTTDQLIGASGPDVVIFNGESSDPGGSYNTSTGEFTASVAGLFQIDASVLYDADGKVGADAYLEILVGGTRLRVGETKVVAGTPARCIVTVAAQLVLSAGAVVTIRLQRPTAGNANSAVIVDFNASYLTITLTAQA
jgi:hypothetical protein